MSSTNSIFLKAALVAATIGLTQPMVAICGELSLSFSAEAGKQGKVHFAVYDNTNDWMKKPVSSAVIPLVNAAAEITLPGLTNGDYAVSAFLDLNGNDKLDRNFIKMPTEPYGFSNGATGSFGPPPFDKAKFTLGTEPVRIAVPLR